MGLENLRHIQDRLDKEKKRPPPPRQVERRRVVEKRPEAIDTKAVTTEKKIEKKKSSKLVNAILSGALFTGGMAGTSAVLDYFDRPDTPQAIVQLSKEKSKLSVEQFTAAKKALPDKMVVAVALLAHSTHPQYAEFDTDHALDDVDKVSKGLVLPLVHRQKVDAAYWSDLAGELEVNDSSTAEVRLDLLKDLSAKYGDVEPIELEESVAYVTRNLNLKRQPITAEAVRAEVGAILERRAALAKENLFDRDTILVSANELQFEGTRMGPRFGPKGLEDGIKKRLHEANPEARFSHVTPLSQDDSGFHSTPESIFKAKERTLDIIAHSPKPLTVFFDGHGGGGFFSLSGHVGNTNETIDFNEVADALTKRWGLKMLQTSQAKEQDVSIVFDDCEMQTFARSLAEVLSSRHVPLPHIMVTTSEWQQNGYSDYFNEYGSRFNQLMIDQKDLGSVMGHKHDVKSSDPSVFTPRKDDPEKLMQVSGIVVASDSAAA